MTATMTRLAVACSNCGESREVKPTPKGNPRPPRGWKSHDGGLLCAACWGETYRIAAVTVPVARADWETLRPALREAQAAATSLSNWAVRKLVANDVTRGPGDAKLAAMPPIYLYGLGPECEAWDKLPKATAGAILQAVEQRYRKRRYDVIWRGESAPPSYRFPQPVPLRPDQYSVREENKRLIVSVPLGGGRHDLTLAGGHQHKRQARALRWLMSHPELMAQAALIEVEGHPGDHRPANDARDNGNGVRRSRRLLIKVVGWLPVKAPELAEGSLLVRADADALLVAADKSGGRAWTYNADHAKRIAGRHAAHLSRLARLSDDAKAERRKPRREGKPYRAMLDERSRKDRARLTSLCHEVSASLVAYAARRKIAEVVYDDSDRSFAASFPWAMLATMIDQKCRASGIVLRLASGPAREKSPSPLAAEQGP